MKTKQNFRRLLYVVVLAFAIWRVVAFIRRGPFEGVGRFEYKKMVESLQRYALSERVRRDKLERGSLMQRQALWLWAKAEYGVWLSGQREKQKDRRKSEMMARQVVELSQILERGVAASQAGETQIPEEQGARLRAYYSAVDDSIQTYSVSLPQFYDPSRKWPLLISLHGNNGEVPFQGHPVAACQGMICLAPSGRDALDYMELSEDDVLATIEEVRREFSVDENRIYLFGFSMGGTGSLNLAVHYADMFAGVMAISANTSSQVWTEQWGLNRKFPGRLDEVRDYLQGCQDSLTYVGNLQNLPCFLMTGAGDNVVSAEHSRRMVEALRQQGSLVQYREYPDHGHADFSMTAVEDAMGWLCSWKREAYPRHVVWRASQMRYGKSYWLKMIQKESPLQDGFIDGVIENNNRVKLKTDNLLSFALYCPPELFQREKPIHVLVNGKQVILPPQSVGKWIELRHDGIHGWDQSCFLENPQIFQSAGFEGPVSAALRSSFIVVYGTKSDDVAKNLAWQAEAQAFGENWTLRNGGICRIMKDTDCELNDLRDCNVLLFGDSRDNQVSELLEGGLPIRKMMGPLVASGVDLSQPDIGTILVYPLGEFGPGHLQVRVSANSASAIWQLWERFGNWFNWRAYDCWKYFDYGVFNEQSCSPETMLMIGWFGTDWSWENGKYFLGNPAVLSETPPQLTPKFGNVRAAGLKLSLVELMPERIQQSQGAVGWGRSFYGEATECGQSIGVKAPSRLMFRLNGRYSLFCTRIHLDTPREMELTEARKTWEKVRMEIYGNGKKLGERILDWRKPSADLQIDLPPGTDSLELVTTLVSGNEGLHGGAVWENPELR